MNTARIAAIALALAACGNGASEPEPEPEPVLPPTVNGTYNLTEAAGKPVGETLLSDREGCTWRQYNEGRLSLAPDSTWLLYRSHTEWCGSGHTTSSGEEDGTYSVRLDSVIVFRETDAFGGSDVSLTDARWFDEERGRVDLTYNVESMGRSDRMVFVR